MKKGVKIILGIIFLAVALGLVFMNFFYYFNCETKECFEEKLSECRRAKFVSSGQMVFEERIKGKSGENCVVNVKLLRGDLGERDSLKLEGKDMDCYLALGVVISPESNIGNCHGLLKEGLQDLIISKQHRYIVQNIGEINLGLGI